MDYRTVVRRFEFDRMLADEGVNREHFGVRYADVMLERIFATNAAKLDRLFPRFPAAHQTLYAVNAFVGEICNGGISQFFFNAVPALREAVPPALERIGDSSVMDRCSSLFAAAENAALQSIRQHAQSWDDFLEFQGELGETAEQFDDWFFDGQSRLLDRKMRSFVTHHKEHFLRICDGVSRLERKWMRRTLRRLIDKYRGYRQNPDWAFYDLLMTPTVRDRLAKSDDERRRKAQSIAASCFPAMNRAYRFPSRAAFHPGSEPRIHIDGKGWFRRSGTVMLAYYEAHEMDMLWGIAEWNGM